MFLLGVGVVFSVRVFLGMFLVSLVSSVFFGFGVMVFCDVEFLYE